MQLIKVVSGSPFKVGERSGKTPRCEGYSRRWRKCTGGAVCSDFDVFLQEQTAAVVSCLDDSTHLVPFGGSEGLPHPTTALTSGVFVTGRKCRPSESPSKDKVLVRFSFFWPASSNFFGTFNKKHSSLWYLHPRRIQEPKQWGLSDKSPLCSVKPAAFKLHHYIQKGPHPFKAATIDLIIVRWQRWRRRLEANLAGVPEDRNTVSVRRLSEENTAVR